LDITIPLQNINVFGVGLIYYRILTKKTGKWINIFELELVYLHMNNNNQQLAQPAAILPRRSRRLATILPASYWISIGYSNEEAEAMEEIQKDMKKYCDGDDEVIMIESDLSVLDYGKTTIELLGGCPGREVTPHHDMMLPHWKKFAKALIGRVSVEILTIVGISLPVSVLDIIFPTLQTMNLSDLRLVDVGLSNEGMLRLSSFLRPNKTIWNLILGVKGVDDLSVATSFSDAIINHPKLLGLSMGGCGSNIASGVIPKILHGCSKLEQVDLALEDNFVSDGIAAISDFIGCNHPVGLVKLNNMKIIDIDSDIAVLVSALKQNTKLWQLDLRNDDITEEGKKALLKSMFDPTNMDSIVKSNHSCIPFTFKVSQQSPKELSVRDLYNSSITARRPILEREVIFINGLSISIKQKIRKKVVLALCGIDGELFDLSHFNNLPLQLMPRVLALIQEHSWSRVALVRSKPNQLERDALSRLLHTLRGWELPLLFENLSPKKGEVGKRKRKKTCR